MSSANTHELKGLQVRVAKLESEINLLEADKDSLVKTIGAKRSELNRLNQRIQAFNVSEPVVTEHALLRYIERVMGVDLKQITDTILSTQNRSAIAFSRNCKIKTNGVELIVKDRKVVSVI